MNILVTGSKGQLGSEIKALSTQKKFSEINFSFHDIDTLDLLDKNALNNHFNSNGYNYVINCAAYTAVDNAEDDKANAYKGNVTIVKNLSELCFSNNSKFIHISTDYVFDGNNFKPYNEDDKVNPIGIYGKTKLQGEEEALKYNCSMIIRTSWLYSSFGNNFVKTMMRLGKERDELGVIFDQIGTPTYAADLAYSILTIVTQIESGKNKFETGIYHYSNEGTISWYDFAKAIMELEHIECKVKAIESHEFPAKVTRPFYSVLNKGKIKNTYNIEIPYWKDSLKNCLNALKNI